MAFQFFHLKVPMRPFCPYPEVSQPLPPVHRAGVIFFISELKVSDLSSKWGNRILKLDLLIPKPSSFRYHCCFPKQMT